MGRSIVRVEYPAAYNEWCKLTRAPWATLYSRARYVPCVLICITRGRPYITAYKLPRTFNRRGYGIRFVVSFLFLKIFLRFLSFLCFQDEIEEEIRIDPTNRIAYVKIRGRYLKEKIPRSGIIQYQYCIVYSTYVPTTRYTSHRIAGQLSLIAYSSTSHRDENYRI